MNPVCKLSQAVESLAEFVTSMYPADKTARENLWVGVNYEIAAKEVLAVLAALPKVLAETPNRGLCVAAIIPRDDFHNVVQVWPGSEVPGMQRLMVNDRNEVFWVRHDSEDQRTSKLCGTPTVMAQRHQEACDDHSRGCGNWYVDGPGQQWPAMPTAVSLLYHLGMGPLRERFIYGDTLAAIRRALEAFGKANQDKKVEETIAGWPGAYVPGALRGNGAEILGALLLVAHQVERAGVFGDRFEAADELLQDAVDEIGHSLPDGASIVLGSVNGVELLVDNRGLLDRQHDVTRRLDPTGGHGLGDQVGNRTWCWRELAGLVAGRLAESIVGRVSDGALN